MRNKKDPEIHTEPTIELLCTLHVVTGNGVRVCHHVDWTWSSQTILWRWQLERKLSFRGPLTLSIATMHYQWTVNTTGKYLPPYTNSSPKESPHLQSWPFVWSSGPILVKNYCLQSAYESASWLCQSGVIFCVDNFWVYSICQYFSWPGPTNIKLHWYDLNHQLHLQRKHISPWNNHDWRPWRVLFFFFFFGVPYQLKIKTVCISPVYI